MIIPAATKLDNINEYYFSRKLKQIRELMAQGKPIINLGIGNPDLPPSETTIKSLQHSASFATNHGYQSYIGTPQLRNSLSKWYQNTYNVSFNAENEILPLLGSKEGISHISHAFLNPNDKVLVPDPGYPTYSSATYLAGATPIYYPLDENNGWAPDWSKIDTNLLAEIKLMWVCYPHMPTGAMGSIEIFKEIIQQAQRYSFLVVNDNPYSLILNKSKPLSIFQVQGAREVAIELNSLSKSHNMAGARVGIAVAEKNYIETILKVKSNVDSGMYLPIQDAAIAALDNSKEWHDIQNKIYEDRREVGYKILDVLKCTYDKSQVGMFLWAKIPEFYKHAEELSDKLLNEADVFITPGFIFGNKGNRYIRISLCSSTEILEMALKRCMKLDKI